jgi:hypothetical protein
MPLYVVRIIIISSLLSYLREPISCCSHNSTKYIHKRSHPCLHFQSFCTSLCKLCHYIGVRKRQWNFIPPWKPIRFQRSLEVILRKDRMLLDHETTIFLGWPYQDLSRPILLETKTSIYRWVFEREVEETSSMD